MNDHKYLFADVSVECEGDGSVVSVVEWLATGEGVEARLAVTVVILPVDSSKLHGNKFRLR